MRNISFIMLIAFSLVLAACGSPEKDLVKIKALEKEVFSDPTGMNQEKAAELVKAYEDYANAHPEDSLAPACLYKAAEVSINLSNGDEAIRFFDRVINEYPTYSKVAEACFLKGFVYEITYKNITKAGEAYKEFLSKYPDHELADDAQASINNLGKTPEQIIKEAQEREALRVQDSLASAQQLKK